MNISLFEVTPDVAEKILSQGDPNFREKNKSRVNIYAEEMRAGRWSPALSMIAFDEDGKLIDGQHRLHAVIESGTTQVFVRRDGVETGDIAKVDVGYTRTAAQMLGSLTKMEPKQLWAAVFQHIIRGDYRVDHSLKITNAELAHWYNTEWQRIEPIFGDGMQGVLSLTYEADFPASLSRPQVVYMWYLMATAYSPDVADDFWNGVYLYQTLPLYDPRRWFGKWLRSQPKFAGGASNQKKNFRRIAYAFNSWVHGSKWTERMPKAFDNPEIDSKYSEPI